MQTEHAFILAVDLRGLEFGEIGLVELVFLLVLSQPLLEFVTLELQLSTPFLTLFLRVLLSLKQGFEPRHVAMEAHVLVGGRALDLVGEFFGLSVLLVELAVAAIEVVEPIEVRLSDGVDDV